MSLILSAIAGFVAPIIPEVFKIFKDKQDHKHELEILKLQSEAKNSESMWRMEEINANAYIEESINIRKPDESYADKIIGATNASKLPILVQSFLAIGAFLVDSAIRMVRPTITFMLVSFYVFYKIQVVKEWTELDSEMLLIVISFWFGGRQIAKRLGK